MPQNSRGGRLYELLNGKIVMMSSPSVNHNRVAAHNFNAFFNYLKGKPCEAFAGGTDVYFTDEDRVIPDVMIICNKDIIRKDGIHGAPDLVVEVLSSGTAKIDKGYKKNLYEQSGVKEYWIVDPNLRSIEVYALSNGKYNIDEIYALFPDNFEFTSVTVLHFAIQFLWSTESAPQLLLFPLLHDNTSSLIINV